MLKTNHLLLPSGNCNDLHKLTTSLNDAITSCSSNFGEDVRWEIRAVIESAERRIQRILDKHCAVRSKNFDKYRIVRYTRYRHTYGGCRATLKEAKAFAKQSLEEEYVRAEIYVDTSLILVFDEQSKNGRKPLREDYY